MKLDKTEFDKFAEEYTNIHKDNIRVSGEAPSFFSEYKIKDLHEITRSFGLSQKLNILDFGCGVGNSIDYLLKYFPHSKIMGVDVSEKSIEIAKQRFSPNAILQSYDGETLPYEDSSLDIIFSACVFHHIPQDLYSHIFKEFRRVLKKDGLFVVFEHNPLNPLTLKAVNTCPFDENAVLIKCHDFKEILSKNAFKEISGIYRIFFPHFLRRLRPIEPILGWLPLGAQYYIVAKNAK